MPSLAANSVYAPLARGLVLSVCLHLALLAVLEFRPVAEAEPGVTLEVRIVGGQRPEGGRAASGPLSASKSPPVWSEVPSQEPPRVPPVPENAVPWARESAVPEPMPASAPSASRPEGVANKAQEGLAVPPLSDVHWYGAREVDAHPRALSRIEPAYPPQARRRGQEGAVKLRLRIDEFGRVSEAEVVEGDPPGVFDAAVLDAVQAAQFLPAKKNGSPVRYDGHYRFVFRLD